MNLFCPDCKQAHSHLLNPWQTANGVKGAISAMCTNCSRLEVLTLGEGFLVGDDILDAAREAVERGGE